MFKHRPIQNTNLSTRYEIVKNNGEQILHRDGFPMHLTYDQEHKAIMNAALYSADQHPRQSDLHPSNYSQTSDTLPVTDLFQK